LGGTAVFLILLTAHPQLRAEYVFFGVLCCSVLHLLRSKERNFLLVVDIFDRRVQLFDGAVLHFQKWKKKRQSFIVQSKTLVFLLIVMPDIVEKWRFEFLLHLL
jgi:hypothetical protein